MRAIWAVYKRETALYFRSPIAYAVAFAVLGFIGLVFTGAVTQSIEQNLMAQMQGGGGIPATALLVATPLITNLMFLIGPLLTMRLIAEENREGTLEVLMTLPMNESAFIIGKFLAVWTYYTVLLLLTLVQVVMLGWIGILDYGTVFTSYLGAWLYGGSMFAVCMIWSAVTEDQVIAAFLGAATVIVFIIADYGATFVSNIAQGATTEWGARIGDALAGFFTNLSVQNHYQSTMVVGLVRAQDVGFFLLLIIGALFITIRIVETRRWRG
jgi:ABC-2 type transport system permease protein